MKGRVMRKSRKNVQLTPHHRHLQRPVIGSCIEDGVGIGIEAMEGPFAPQQGAVGVRAGDAVDSESGDGEREFEDEEGDEDLGRFPMAGDEHLVGFVRKVQRDFRFL